MSNAGTSSQKAMKGPKSFQQIHIDEEVKIAVTLSMDRFRCSDQIEMMFPTSLTSTERAFVHHMARFLGFISKSKNKGSNRFLVVTKKTGEETFQSSMPLTVSQNSIYAIRNLVLKFPITHKERMDLQTENCNGVSAAAETQIHENSKNSGHLSSNIPMVPQRRRPSELDSFRRSLPVHERQEEILKLIRENKVVLVLGETGSGKTTQIPQFLLDECSRKGERCRIVCTQPRRLAAIAVAERVAAERGETVGQAVGYHIRLESRVSMKTRLTFCTSGVFLRTLMAGDYSMATFTHIIVDEVHERDGLTDFLLTKVREVLQKVPSLKLILSSAALDIDLFLNYFGSCPVIHLRGRQFEVKEFFLEDVLKLTGFKNNDVKKYKEEAQKNEKKQKALTEWCTAVETSSVKENQRTPGSLLEMIQHGASMDGGESSLNSPKANCMDQMKPWLLKEMDACISNIFLNKDQDAFNQLFNLIQYENVNVDYTHSETGATALMVAAGRGFLAQMEQLLSMGADINVKASNGWSALDFAECYQQEDAVDLLKSSIPLGVVHSQDQTPLEEDGVTELSAEEQELLSLYHHSFNDEWVDLDLIMDLLHYICSSTSSGAVLIFLPGYDDIVSLRDRILYDDKRFSAYADRYQVFTLHSDMHTLDQRNAMRPSPPRVRKLILSTNIAETSITINDVVFVIDSGKVKEKSFDTFSHVSMLKTVWISKASALQRKGRAGRCRPGVCFHLFSRRRFNNMLEFQIPQLLRMPLQEVCLQTKLLAPPSCAVSEFLSKAPEPPPSHAIKSAMERLMAIDAMDKSENLTDLGIHLADLPLEPHLGKMVLCGVLLKCLDPILTIACALGYRDPFLLPSQGSQKKAALQCRKNLTSGSFSDHMALLRAFQAWQNACSCGMERSFCEENFLSQATMDMIFGMRTQLLGQLRAIGFVRNHGGSDIRDVNQNSENWAMVKAALVAGMYPNLVHINRETSQLSSNKEKKVHFHPTSVLSQSKLKERGPAQLAPGLPTDWLIYDEMSRGDRMASVRCCSLVTPVTIAIFGGGAKISGSALQGLAGSPQDDVSDSEAESHAEIRIDPWLVFQMEKEAAELVLVLRQKWQNLFMKRMRCPSKSWTQQEDTIIQTLASVLTAEELAAGLQQPSGIGQRPLQVSAEDGSHTASKSSKDTPQPPSQASSDRSATRPASSLSSSKKLFAGGPLQKTVRDASQPAILPPYCSNSSSSGSPSAPVSGQDWFYPESHQQCLLPVRFFIMKSSKMKNIAISQQKGIWSTTAVTEHRLVKAFLESSTIFLIFSVQGSRHFQGYARMSSAANWDRCHDWGFVGQGGVFSVDWIHRESLPFYRTNHILNPWNDNKKVQISRDGQELETKAGRQLLLLWEQSFGSVAQ